ncbi:MAG: transposase [Maribacter dokdonensis]|uniref:transposase n=1 Tax=Maribacter dokdonensis TaxID=320912 RepID=UPI003299A326
MHSNCLGKSAKEKKFSATYYRAEYLHNIARVESPLGRYMKGKRQSTVEPVFGTLTQFIKLRKINTIGLAWANKVMHHSAIAYNLKKYLKFENKRPKSGTGKLALSSFVKSMFHYVKSLSPVHLKFHVHLLAKQKKSPLRAYIGYSFLLPL